MGWLEYSKTMILSLLPSSFDFFPLTINMSTSSSAVFFSHSQSVDLYSIIGAAEHNSKGIAEC
jgi:hypothetical protein